MNPTYLKSSIILLTSSIALTACGGEDKVKDEYNRAKDKVRNIADDIKDDYKKFEDKLSNKEKDMAEILESVFLPENSDEELDKFLDKITPEGGKGGLYVGHFIETDDGNSNDIDIGSIYFDIPKNYGSVNGRVSYQQKACQANRTLSTKSAVKVDEILSGRLSGSLDTLKFLDMKYVRDFNLKTPNVLTTFVGSFKKDQAGSPWSGNFQYQDGLGGTQLSSGEKNCDVTYTLSNRSSYTTYPLDFELGKLDIKVTGIGSTTSLQWTNPKNAKLVLVNQININSAESGANGFERNQIFKYSENQYTPLMTDTPTNYAFVVQAFDKNNRLIAFDSIVIDLPRH